MRDIADMIAEACMEVYGEEWGRMTGQQQHDIIIGFIAESARRAAQSKEQNL